MELRQRGQRASEPTDQNHPSSGNAPQWNAQQPPPPPPPLPPRRTSAPTMNPYGASPMFLNPNSYAGRSASHSDVAGDKSAASANSTGGGTSTPHAQRYPPPQQRSASAPYIHPLTAPPNMQPWGRSKTEPQYQTDAVANSAAATGSPAASRYGYPNAPSSVGAGGVGTDGGPRSSGGRGFDRGAGAAPYYSGCDDPRSGSSAGVDANPRGYGGYGGVPQSGFAPSAPSSSNYANPYKASSKPGRVVRILTSLAYLSIFILSASTLYLRHAIQVAGSELEQAHQDAHRRHLSHVKKTGGRHGTAKTDQLARSNQQREQERLQNSNVQIQKQIDAKHQEYSSLQRRLEEEHSKLDGLEQTKQNLLRLIDHAHVQLENLDMEKEKHAAVLKSKEELDRVMVKREEALWERVGRLTERIGRESWREAEEWFGPGPHKIEMELSYPHVPPEDHPNPQSWTRVSKWIVVELAPLDLMPHSVNLFLRQIHHKLWDGLAAKPSDETKILFGPKPENDWFARTRADKLLYQEYSDKYPHRRWTLGFEGRPAGPEFYFNAADNSELHGPKGDDKHAEADPCFGTVVEGAEVLERISMIPKYRGGEEEGLAGLYEVKILRALLIKPKEEVQQKEEEAVQH